jgi:predicted Zn-dependent protease
VYSPVAAARARAQEDKDRKEAEEAARVVAEEDEKRRRRAKSIASSREKAPRLENGELMIKRREVHSGRALTVSTGKFTLLLSPLIAVGILSY